MKTPQTLGLISDYLFPLQHVEKILDKRTFLVGINIYETSTLTSVLV